MKTRTLHCKLGNHDWSRESQKGRLPINCPEHQPVVEKPERLVKKETPQERGKRVSSAARQRDIQEALDTRPSFCTCKIHVDMTDDELKREEVGCNPYFVCTTVDNLRRKLFKRTKDDEHERVTP
jgi:hypothetical protein